MFCTASKKYPITRWFVEKTSDPTCSLKELQEGVPTGFLTLNEDFAQTATDKLIFQ